MTIVFAQRRRRLVRGITILDRDGEAILPGVNDQVRIRIGRQGRASDLSFASNAASDNGSTVVKGTENTVTIDAEDLDFTPGTYTMFVDYFDNADGSEWKVIDRQVFHLEDSETEL